MKLKRTPSDISAWLEVTPEELHELEQMGGLILKVEAGRGGPAYYWHIQGTWILLTVKESKSRTAAKRATVET